MRAAMLCRIVALCGVTLTASACGDSVGAPCEIRGSGFHASHDCASKCLSRWNVVCPDGTSLSPRQCAGKPHCEPGSCPDDQLCYHFDDPFDKRSYCVANTICGAPITGATARAWEIEADERAAASRERMRKKFNRSPGPVTAPAASDDD